MLSAHVSRTATGRGTRDRAWRGTGPGGAAGSARPGAAAVVLCRQCRLPLSRAVAGGTAVRPAGRARGGVAADSQRGRGLRALAAAVAPVPAAGPAAGPATGPGQPPHAARPRSGAGRDEHDVLPRGGPAAA